MTPVRSNFSANDDTPACCQKTALGSRKSAATQPTFWPCSETWANRWRSLLAMALTIRAGLEVTVHYRLSLDDGTVLEDSAGKDPLRFVHGAGQIVPGLERVLEGKDAGFECEVEVDAADGYGEYDPSAEQPVPRTQFPADVDLQPGMAFQADGPKGPVSVWVHRIEQDNVVITSNHPLAGQRLNFKVRVVDVREATAAQTPPQDSG